MEKRLKLPPVGTKLPPVGTKGGMQATPAGGISSFLVRHGRPCPFSRQRRDQDESVTFYDNPAKGWITERGSNIEPRYLDSSFENFRSCFSNSLLDGFVEKGFGCGYVSFIVSLPKADPPMAERLKAKPTSETDT